MHGDFDGFLFDIAEFFEDCARRFEQVIAFHIFEHEPFAAELRELFVNCIGFGAKRSIVFDGNGERFDAFERIERKPSIRFFDKRLRRIERYELISQ